MMNSIVTYIYVIDCSLTNKNDKYVFKRTPTPQKENYNNSSFCTRPFRMATALHYYWHVEVTGNFEMVLTSRQNCMP